MAYTSCVTITESTTEELNSERGRARALDLLAAGAPAADYIAALAEHMPKWEADLLRQEFEELPASMVNTIVQAWVMAESAGREFTLTSVRPDRPLEFARSQRVRFQVDIEADRVVVALSHVPGRHADWYQPASALSH